MRVCNDAMKACLGVRILGGETLFWVGSKRTAHVAFPKYKGKLL